MIRSQFFTMSTIAFAAIVLGSTPAIAAKKAPVELTRCDASYGTIAVVEGDTQGWSKFGLGSPRELVAAIARESGCFEVHSGASAAPANFLVNVIAGDKEEVDQGIQTAKGLATQALVRSGAAGQVLSRVPGAGALMGMFGGLGGKKKTVAAGIRVISPANGQTLAAGTGEVKKSTLSFAGGTPWIAGAEAAGYGASKDGKMLTEAFILARPGPLQRFRLRHRRRRKSPPTPLRSIPISMPAPMPAPSRFGRCALIRSWCQPAARPGCSSRSATNMAPKDGFRWKTCDNCDPIARRPSTEGRFPNGERPFSSPVSIR